MDHHCHGNFPVACFATQENIPEMKLHNEGFYILHITNYKYLQIFYIRINTALYIIIFVFIDIF